MMFYDITRIKMAMIIGELLYKYLLKKINCLYFSQERRYRALNNRVVKFYIRHYDKQVLSRFKTFLNIVCYYVYNTIAFVTVG